MDGPGASPQSDEAQQLLTAESVTDAASTTGRHTDSLVSAIVGDDGAPNKLAGRTFSSTHQPAAASRNAAKRTRERRMACEFETDPEKRRKILWRHLKTLRATVEFIEKATDTPIMVLCSTKTDGNTGHPIVRHVLGRPDSSIMRACWSDERCVRARIAIWDAETAEQASGGRSASVGDAGTGRTGSDAGKVSVVGRPDTVPVIDVDTARTQVRAELGSRPGFGKPDRKPEWWPDAVPWRADYSLQRMSKRDLGNAYAAMCKHQHLTVQRVVSAKVAAKALDASTANAISGCAADSGVVHGAVAPDAARNSTLTAATAQLPPDIGVAGVTGLDAGDARNPPPIPSRYTVQRGGPRRGDIASRSTSSSSGREATSCTGSRDIGTVASRIGTIPSIPARPRSCLSHSRVEGDSTGSTSAAALAPTGHSTPASSETRPEELRASTRVTTAATRMERAAPTPSPASTAPAQAPAPVSASSLDRQQAESVGEMPPPAARQPRRKKAYTSFLSLRSEQQEPSERAGETPVVSSDVDAKEQQRDVFLHALANVAEGRAWNSMPFDVASMGCTSLDQRVTRRFELQIIDSATLCPHGTRVDVVAVDLYELCTVVSKSLPLRNMAANEASPSIRIEDPDFCDWIGPLAVADVSSVATIRVKTDDYVDAEVAQIERYRQFVGQHRQWHGAKSSPDKPAEEQQGHRNQHQRRTQRGTQAEPIVGLRMM